MSYTEAGNQFSNCNLKQKCTWSTEHRKLQATAMSVDWTGEWALLAGRRHLALQPLDPDKMEHDENGGLKMFYRNSKYEVSAAEWAICEGSREYCAIAVSRNGEILFVTRSILFNQSVPLILQTSQLIEVVTWTECDPMLKYSLRAHTRMVTDIDWHSKTPHLLASCSIDTFTHLWDLRDPRKPVMSLSAVCMCK